MRNRSPIFLLLTVPVLMIHAQDVDRDKLLNSVMSQDVQVLASWLSPERVADENQAELIQQLVLLAIEQRKERSLDTILQSGVRFDRLQTPELDWDVYRAAAEGPDAVLQVLKEHDWSPDLSFAAWQSRVMRLDEENGGYGSNRIDDPDMDKLLKQCLEESNLRFLRLCLETGLSPDYSLISSRGTSLLNKTIEISNLDAFNMLLQHKASITKVTSLTGFKTTLALAIELQGEKSPFVQKLKDLGALKARYTSLTPKKAMSSTDRLRIRTSPDLSGAIVGYLMKGDEVQLLEVTALTYSVDDFVAPWIRIKRGNVQGWVYGGYLETSIYGDQSPH